MTLSTLDLGLIIGGAFLIILAIFIAVFCRISRLRSNEEDRLIDGTGDSINAPSCRSSNLGEWAYGELDRSGVRRVYAWVEEVRRAHMRGVTPIPDELCVESTLLGHIDEIGSPPQGSSPRVSNIGSDDGERYEYARHSSFLQRDPFSR
jgi:hypothetical protein